MIKATRMPQAAGKTGFSREVCQMPDEDFVQEQTELWDAMQEETVNEAVG